ncbi:MULTISPECIES: hypothetical protein [Vibrio]|uniref:hypothetical protein n=1 Tax=Vibrio TaxID=662 RepID=UPI00218627FC|nr:hypothetical protein [Vibrio coralliilyticus]USD33732.1 hypothetical protein J8Z27_06425 [Vibrio sp. SCSIO 43186]USD46803.1 hypothetical protein J4N38_06625 [Vibrio sp. SCSIO 43145]USD70856.1 hypothetical protein J4N41_06425 [Vibrio sp. SCSIO 43139]USD95769.1 hypothetical protein CTT30_06530 [Vibrio coralliilyticus]
MSIPNHQLKTDNQRLAVLCLVVFGVYGGLLEFCGIVGSRLARALGCFKLVWFVVLQSATSIVLFVTNLSGHVARTFSGEGFIQLASLDVSG